MSFEIIDKMSASEQLNAMEYLWNALIARHSAAVPSWHADVLDGRRQKIESGEAEYLSIDEAQMQLNEESYAH